MGRICRIKPADKLCPALYSTCILHVWICSGNNWTQNVSSAQSVLAADDLQEVGSKKHFTAILNSVEVKQIDAEDEKIFAFYFFCISHSSLHDTSNPLTPSPPKTPPQKPHHRPEAGLYSVSGGQVTV